MPHGKPLSNPRGVSVGAFQGLLTAWAGMEELGRGPVKPQGHNRSCVACGAERDGHPVARPPLPFCDHPAGFSRKLWGWVRWTALPPPNHLGPSRNCAIGRGPQGEAWREKPPFIARLYCMKKRKKVLGDAKGQKNKSSGGCSSAVSSGGLAAIAPPALLPICVQ